MKNRAQWSRVRDRCCIGDRYLDPLRFDGPQPNAYGVEPRHRAHANTVILSATRDAAVAATLSGLV